MKFIIKLFPEITIKSKPVRKRLIQRLQSNIQNILFRISPKIKVSGVWDKLEVILPPELLSHTDEVAGLLGKIPGIHAYTDVLQFPLGSFHEVFEQTLPIYQDRLKGKTFKVRVKRKGTHDFTSVELEQYVGGGLRQHCDNAGVDIRNPDVWVDLQVDQDTLYIVNQSYVGLGGYPLGSLEPVLSLISGGFDSIVSSYMTMRRGCKTHFLFFNLGGIAHEVAVKQIAHRLWTDYGSSARVKFITVPFEEVVGEIMRSVDHSHMGVVLKRMMLRVADQIAEESGYLALVTGESMAQVSSQTLPNLQVIDSVTDRLVLRPLITTDKQEIIDTTKRLGLFDFASAIPEYCGVISKKPTTCAKKKRVLEEESEFDMEVLQSAVRDRIEVSIDAVMRDLAEGVSIQSLTRVEKHQTVVDVRHPIERDKKPLNLPGSDLLYIPFFKFRSEMESLKADREYLLYCEKGVMSQMLAEQLVSEGVANIKVYRPLQ